MAYDPNKPEDYYYNNPDATNYASSPAMEKKQEEQKQATMSQDEINSLATELSGYSPDAVDTASLATELVGTNTDTGEISLDVVASIKQDAQTSTNAIDSEIKIAQGEKNRILNAMNMTSNASEKEALQRKIDSIDLSIQSMIANKSKVGLAAAKELDKVQKDKVIVPYFDVGDWFKNRLPTELQGLYYGTGEALRKLYAIPEEAAAWMLDATGNEDKANMLRADIKNAVNIWGGNIAQVKTDRIKKYGTDAWGVGEFIGEMSPEFAVGKVAKTIPAMVYEAGLSSARNELFTSNDVPLPTKLFAISSDVVMAGIGMKVMSKILPTNQVKQFEQYINSIEDPVARKTVEDAIKSLDNAGIDNLEYDARDRLLKQMLAGKFKDDKQLGEAIRNELLAAKSSEKQIVQKLYDNANAEAKKTAPASLSELLTNFSNFDAKTAFDKIDTQAPIKTQFIDYIKNKGSMNAYDLENAISTYKDYLRGAKDETKASYSAIVSFLQDEQDKILKASVLEGLYVPARDASKKYNVLFEGRAVKNEEFIATGKKVAKTIYQPQDFGVNKELFSGALNPNTAKAYVTRIKGDAATREASVLNLMVQGIDDISSAEGIRTMMKNYSSMNKDGIQIMLGDARAKELATNMNAMGIIMQNIGELEKMDKQLGADVVNLVGAVAASKISPYASMHVAINSSKNILKKLGSREGALEKARITRKLGEYIKDNPNIQNISRGILMMQLPTDIQTTKERTDKAYKMMQK